MSEDDSGQGAKLQLETRWIEDAVVISVAGELDIATAPALREQLLRVFAEQTPGHVVVDLTLVTFLDGATLGVLVGARRRLHHDDARMTIVALERVTRVIRAAGLDQAWQLVDSLEAALTAAPPPPP
ncbi:MAG: anti-sigma factor antagonist [Actinomycetota bacterium]|nr:anti-sigma factor antagonist [Actinomycetota bacterium]